MVVTLGQQYNVGEKPTVIMYTYINHHVSSVLYRTVSYLAVSVVFYSILKKNQNASRLSEHPPVRGKNVKTFRWDHRVQIQDLFVAFKRVPRW